jgi:hypothetical protein
MSKESLHLIVDEDMKKYNLKRKKSITITLETLAENSYGGRPE